MRPCLLLLLASCDRVSVVDVPLGDNPDAGEPIEAVVAPDTGSGFAAVPCDSEPPPPRTLAIDPRCDAMQPVAVDWALVEVARLGLGDVRTVHLGRVVDLNRDRVVDLDDPVQVVVTRRSRTADERGVAIAHLDGSIEATLGVGDGLARLVLGDLLDRYSGAELVVTFKEWRSDEELRLFDEDGSRGGGATHEHAPRTPWLFDADNDGDLEIAIGTEVYDETFTSVVSLEGLVDQVVAATVAVDLGGGSRPEIVAVDISGGVRVGFYDHQGSLTRWCVDLLGDPQPLDSVTLAVADLDRDDEGDVLVGFAGGLLACDATGAWLGGTDVAGTPDRIVVAELDGDPWPEIVVTGNGTAQVFSHDLDAIGEPFAADAVAAADLDGDGLHELIVHVGRRLAIRSRGEEVASIPTLDRVLPSGPPVVADIDGDGLAEIVVPGVGGPAVVENADGGWPVYDPTELWPGEGHFPGDRGPAGRPTAAGWRWWRDHDVFNAMSAITHVPARPNLLARSVDACFDDEGVLVTAGVANAGPSAAVDTPIALWADGAEVARGTVTVEPGEERGLVLRVPREAARGGLELRVTPDPSVDDCGRGRKTLAWTAP